MKSPKNSAEFKRLKLPSSVAHVVGLRHRIKI
jgi:hypothetical protein